MGLSDNKDRLVEHLIAFANQANGGFLVYGIADTGTVFAKLDQIQVEEITGRLVNLGRNAIDPPLVLDHAVVDYRNAPLLFVYVPEQQNKPVHRRGKTIEEAWIRSGGTTRKAARSDIGALMLHSQSPSWEELRATPLLPEREVITRLDLEAVSKLLQRPLPGERHELLRWMSDQNMVVPDGAGYYITNLGAIAAARDLAAFDSLQRKRTRVIRYRGTNKTCTIDELVGKEGYAVRL